MAKRKRNYDDPLCHPDHERPVTRRDFLSQGFISGSAFALGGGVLSLFSNPREALAALSGDLQPLLSNPCDIATVGAGKIPFIAFDLAGGANIANSNVLVGKEGGQMDFLNTSGYEKMGLPGDMVPGLTDPGGLPYANVDFGLAFHSDSAFKRGMEASMSDGRGAQLNGAVIPARSDNDTGNNPHNPMKGIARAGADGSILTLAGTENSDSGGNSTEPVLLMDPELRPTKVDRPSDVTALVDTGELVGILGPDDATAVMESALALNASIQYRSLTFKSLCSSGGDMKHRSTTTYRLLVDLAWIGAIMFVSLTFMLACGGGGGGGGSDQTPTLSACESIGLKVANEVEI